MILEDGVEDVEELAEALRRQRRAFFVAREVDQLAQAPRVGIGEFLHEALHRRGIVDELGSPALRDVQQRLLAPRRRVQHGELLGDRGYVQVAVIRGKALVLNLPGQPKSIRETLEGLKTPEGKTLVAGIFAAVPYCVDLLGGPYIETREAVVKAFRPKSAVRAPRS